MKKLAEQKIVVVGKDAQAASPEQIEAYLERLPGWNIVEREGIPRLEKSFQFKNYVEALAFTNLVSEMAEEVDHHPAILLTWGRSAVSWWTHVIGGLHENDFIAAARTEKLYETR